MKEPKKFPEQQQSQPGKEKKMNPEPEIIKKSYKGSGKLKGKTALITGGDSGIGRSVAVHFAIEGANVAIVFLKEDEDAQTTKKLVEDAGQKCLIIEGDLKNEDFCRKIVAETVKEFGGLNILVNNAATQMLENKLEDISWETQATYSHIVY